MGGGIMHYMVPGYTTDEPRLHPVVPEQAYIKEMIKAGEDPKPMVLEECKPQCHYFEGKL